MTKTTGSILLEVRITYAQNHFHRTRQYINHKIVYNKEGIQILLAEEALGSVRIQPEAKFLGEISIDNLTMRVIASVDLFAL